MSDQYVFELQFKRKSDGSDFKENQFVIIDGGSMADLAKLREDLNKCVAEPFNLHYLDEEDDMVAIDSEAEFKEFAKLVKHRSIRGMLTRLILHSNPPEDIVKSNNPSNQVREEAGPSTYVERDVPRKENEVFERELPADPCWEETLINELKQKLKTEIREEIMSEIKEKMGVSNMVNAVAKDDVDYTEDSDGNQVYLPERRKFKFATKKLGRKEKFESELEQRIQKLELKKKKLLEKVSLKSSSFTKAFLNRAGDLPFLMSGIVTEDCIRLGKITVGKTFLHLWHIVNDGTADWKGVILRHYWSSPGLETDETVLKCPDLPAGQAGHLYVKFKAPQTEASFVSYWHFYSQVGSHWQQFGHYVSLTGATKAPKASNPNDIPMVNKAPDSTKKSKQGTKNVTFSTEVEQVASSDPTKEVQILDEESTYTYMMKVEANQKQLEAKLASAQIAAEMAREAANVAFRRAMTQDKHKDGDRKVEETMKEKQHNECDTDPNIEINEEADPGFVMVNLPSILAPGVKMRLRVESIADSTVENELNETHPENNIENKTVTSSTEKNESNGMNGNETLENTNCVAEEEAEGPKQPAAGFPYVVHGYGSYGKVDDSQQPMSFPKLDTGVNYPVFPPPPPRIMAVYPPLPQLPHQHNPHGYPVFPPQNTPPAFVLTPPPFNPPKLNTTTMHYSHPNFPTHHMPIISSCVPPSGISPPSQIPQPQIPIATPPGYAMNHPVRVFGVENIANPMATTYADKRKSESKTSTTANSTSAPASCTNSSINQTEASSATVPTATHAPVSGVDMVQHNVDKTKEAEPTGVQILPQALVDGAINVAATAYSTAWNALNNLRPKEGDASEFDPVFENNLALLSEMGFNNLERNARLLKRFNNDIAKVIGIICATGGGHNLEID